MVSMAVRTISINTGPVSTGVVMLTTCVFALLSIQVRLSQLRLNQAREAGCSVKTLERLLSQAADSSSIYSAV